MDTCDADALSIGTPIAGIAMPTLHNHMHPGHPVSAIDEPGRTKTTLKHESHVASHGQDSDRHVVNRAVAFQCSRALARPGIPMQPRHERDWDTFWVAGGCAITLGGIG